MENRLFSHMRHEIFEDTDRESAYKAVTDAIDSVNDAAMERLCALCQAEAAAYAAQHSGKDTDKDQK